MNAPLIRLNKGDAVVIDGVWHHEKMRTKGSLTLSPIGGEVARTFTGDEFRDLYFDPAGRMKIVRREMALLDQAVAQDVARPFESFAAEQQAEMLRRFEYVGACDRFFARKLYSKRPEGGYAKIARIVARYRRSLAAREAGCAASEMRLERVSGSTLRDWYGRWLGSGRMLGAIAPLTHRRGNADPKLDPAVRAIIADAVREKWLTLEAPPLTVVYDLICRRVEVLNEGRAGGAVAEPSEMAVRRWIEENVDPYTETFFRKGRKEADHNFRLIGRAPVAVRPLQIVEFDETPLDILLVDSNGRPRGRANLTAGICVATGMIVGWQLGYEKPSWSTVMQALRMAVLKKELGDSGAESPYPVFGVPEMIKVDNGPAYRSTSLIAAAGQLQFELRLVPVGKPNLKGKVERFFREVSKDFLSVFPGKTFSNVQLRGDYDSEGCAKMTLETARRLFMRWVVDIYHNRPNSRCFGQTPLERWEALAGCGVRVPPEAMDLAPLIGLVVNRTIQADGIAFMGLTYRDPILRSFRRSGHMGKEWLVKIDPLDISELLVLDEERKCWVRIPCQQPDLVEGLTLKMWMDVVSSARAVTRQGQRVRRSVLLRARENLIHEAEAMGNVSRGKITAAEYRWIEAELENEQYEISVEPDDPDEATRPDRRPKNRRRARQPGENEQALDPSMSAPASQAGGHPVADQELPGADEAQREREFREDAAEDDEAERAEQFRTESALLKADAISNGPSSQTPPLAPEDASVPQATVSDAAPEAVIVSLRKFRDARNATDGPQRLIDDDDDENWT
jgi:putative transposase